MESSSRSHETARRGDKVRKYFQAENILGTELTETRHGIQRSHTKITRSASSMGLLGENTHKCVLYLHF
jgi:hypothetical protein